MTASPTPLLHPLAHWALRIASILSATSCGSTSTPPATTDARSQNPSDNPLILAREAHAERLPSLTARLTKSPFAYFRYINPEFTELVCRRLETKVQGMPRVNLHGDAHLEQYAVADDGRGLVDFDAAGQGPPIVDWIRFATSVRIVADAIGERASADEAIRSFLAGYREALKDPSMNPAEPAVAARIRSRFVGDRSHWLDTVSRMIQPIDEAKRAMIEDGRERYIDSMLAQNPAVTRDFFTMKKIGPIDMGIGSAREAKFLARVEGPTSATDDDVILETKEVAPMRQSCVDRGPAQAEHVILGQARLSNAPQRYLGSVRIEGKAFYVQAWRVHYTELEVSDIRSGSELVELAHDVGVQLGKGQPKDIGGIAELRQNLDAAVVESTDEVLRTSTDLAEISVEAWKSFVAGARPR